MRLLVLLPLLLPLTASARDMAPLNNPELATVLDLFQELVTTPSNSDHPKALPSCSHHLYIVSYIERRLSKRIVIFAKQAA